MGGSFLSQLPLLEGHSVPHPHIRSLYLGQLVLPRAFQKWTVQCCVQICPSYHRTSSTPTQAPPSARGGAVCSSY